MTNFEVSENQYDEINIIKSSTYGVWFSIKSSSTIFLYDESNYQCKLVFDTLTNLPKNLENVQRIILRNRIHFDFKLR